jgi:type IV pilus assembly protein PilM
VISIPPGAMLSGKIQDPIRLTDILREFQKKESIRRVRVSLPEEQVYLFELRVPRTSPETIPGTIELSLEEHIPIKAAETVFDYSLIRETETSFDLQVAALPALVAESYVSVFENAGLEPVSLELEAQAIARAVTQKGDPSTVLIIDFGETRTGISIVEAGLVRFTTTLEIGGYAITKTIEKTFNCSFAEAERMKRTIGLSRKPEHQELFSTLLQSIAVLRDEVNKHYIYWHTHKDELGGDHAKIQNLILVGGNANMPGLEDYLSASLKTKVAIANPWVNITDPNERIPRIESADALAYATALGLALGGNSYD